MTAEPLRVLSEHEQMPAAVTDLGPGLLIPAR